MKILRMTLILLVSLTLLAACKGSTTSRDSQNSASTTTEMLKLTISELAEYNGQEGKPAYIAVDGIIYDVSDIGVWEGGRHNGYQAGKDWTDEFPHAQSRLDMAIKVGTLVSDESDADGEMVTGNGTDDSSSDMSEDHMTDDPINGSSDADDSQDNSYSDDDHDDDDYDDDNHDDDYDDDNHDDDDYDDDNHDADNDDDNHDDDYDDDNHDDDDYDDNHDDDYDDDNYDDDYDDNHDDDNHDDDNHDDDYDDDHEQTSGDDTQLRVFTEDELLQYNGKDGNPAYIAFEGYVYDVSRLSLWSGGEHNGIMAGYDLTDDIAYAPHGDEMLERAELIGILE